MSLSKSCRHKHNISIPHQDTSNEAYGFGWITGKVTLCWLNRWKSISLLTGGGSSEAPMCLNSLPRQAPRHGKCFCQNLCVSLPNLNPAQGVMPRFWSISTGANICRSQICQTFWASCFLYIGDVSRLSSPTISQPFQPINPKDGVVGVALSEPLDAALRLSVVKMGPSLEATQKLPLEVGGVPGGPENHATLKTFGWRSSDRVLLMWKGAKELFRIGMFFWLWQSIQYTIRFTVIYMHIGVHLSMSGWPVGFRGPRLPFYRFMVMFGGNGRLVSREKQTQIDYPRANKHAGYRNSGLVIWPRQPDAACVELQSWKDLDSTFQHWISFKFLQIVVFWRFHGHTLTRVCFLLLVTVTSKEQHAKPSRRLCWYLCLHWSLYTSSTTIPLNEPSNHPKPRVWKWQVAKSGPNPEGGFLVEVIRIQGKEWWGVLDPVLESMGVAIKMITHSIFLTSVFLCAWNVGIYVYLYIYNYINTIYI